MAPSDPAPDPHPAIERIPFTRLGGWAATHLWANWVFFVSILWVAAGGLYLLFVFAGPNEDVGFPELMYGVGALLVVGGMQMILLDLLAEHHRANVRLYAEIGTETRPAPQVSEEIRQFLNIFRGADQQAQQAGVKAAEAFAKKPGNVTLNYNAVLDAVRTLPLARFLIVAGLLTMFLGAGVDDLWDVPNVTFTTGTGAGATPES